MVLSGRPRSGGGNVSTMDARIDTGRAAFRQPSLSLYEACVPGKLAAREIDRRIMNDPCVSPQTDQWT
jgi:hypothetical protein